MAPDAAFSLARGVYIVLVPAKQTRKCLLVLRRFLLPEETSLFPLRGRPSDTRAQPRSSTSCIPRIGPHRKGGPSRSSAVGATVKFRSRLAPCRHHRIEPGEVPKVHRPHLSRCFVQPQSYLDFREPPRREGAGVSWLPAPKAEGWVSDAEAVSLLELAGAVGSFGLMSTKMAARTLATMIGGSSRKDSSSVPIGDSSSFVRSQSTRVRESVAAISALTFSPSRSPLSE